MSEPTAWTSNNAPPAKEAIAKMVMVMSPIPVDPM
jgi:hypothetical protein